MPQESPVPEISSAKRTRSRYGADAKAQRGNEENDEMKKRGRLGGIQDVLTLGIQMAVGMALFTWLGWWLDRSRGGGRAFTLCGMFLGLFYGFYEVWKVTRRTDGREGEEDHPPNTRNTRKGEKEQTRDDSG